VSSVESPKGNLIYFVMASEGDKPFRVKVRDPAFMNWQTIQFAVLGDIVADFPLINKSMNLSYSGNDL
jgi:Ni,Fe-hydrogenase III large subunit